jgi:hypothetical protein
MISKTVEGTPEGPNPLRTTRGVSNHPHQVRLLKFIIWNGTIEQSGGGEDQPRQSDSHQHTKRPIDAHVGNKVGPK